MKRWQALFSLVSLLASLLACTLTEGEMGTLTPIPVSATPLPVPPSPPPQATIPVAEGAILPLIDVTYLLQDVCFDALLPYAGNSFILNSQTEMDQFFALLNVPTACQKNFVPPLFDFSQKIIIGVVASVRGCTAALIPQLVAAEGQDLRVTLQMAINPACNYDLLATFIAAMDRPPAGMIVSIGVIQ